MRLSISVPALNTVRIRLALFVRVLALPALGLAICVRHAVICAMPALRRLHRADRANLDEVLERQ